MRERTRTKNETPESKLVTFYQPRPLAAVHWDAERDKPLFEFKNHVFQTSDPELIKKMKDLGYPTEPPENTLGANGINSGFIRNNKPVVGTEIPGA